MAPVDHLRTARLDRVRTAPVDRIRRLAAPIAVAAGIELPQLRLSRFAAGAECRRIGPDRYLIVLPAHRAVRDTDDTLRATLAHELAHAEYGDPKPEGPRARALICLVALLITASIMVLISAAGLLIRKAVASFNDLVAPLLSLLLITVVIGLITLAAGELIRRTGRARKVALHLEELRADLRAVQLVGAAPVRQWRAAVAARPLSPLTRWLESVIDTHPSPTDRLHAVETYNPTTNPTTAAHTFLQARPLV